jgi:hypothetical protein
MLSSSDLFQDLRIQGSQNTIFTVGSFPLDVDGLGRIAVSQFLDEFGFGDVLLGK